MRHTAIKNEGVEAVKQAEGKARKLFWGSLLLNVLIVVHLFYVAGKSGGLLSIVRTFLPAVLLWSLTMTGYAFYVLHTIARQRAETLAGALIDVATGLFNLGYLKSCLEQERRRALEMGTPAIVVYLDMANLEKVNQDFGHTVGDIVLKGVAQLIANNVRRGDVVGRVGGDEFLIIMPETTVQEAESVMDSMRRVIEGYRLSLGKRGTIDFLGCMIGFAIFPSEGERPEDIMAVARQRLAAVASAQQAVSVR